MKKFDEYSEAEIDEAIQQLAKRIKQLRKNKGYSSHENFAFDNGIARAQYWRYEKGSDIRFSSLMKLAKVHGMTLEEFFSEGFD